ncbi:hypothetical protein [Nannocystis punicea]|uniref:Antistasin-like domain-containing protein n=1 Tax=Nannocystis punicea TaxID=2995304 RepID=A0ABY7HF63_9BACT|nr:hypothetical protein [Nannocystis poenicansa]WAS97735.1 hypothetical protein O0S08_16450 [Nannocystis poenicansa]
MRSLPLSVVLCAAALACDILPPGVAVRAAQAVPVAAETNAADTATTGDLCEGFTQPGCVQTGCPEGQVCQQGLQCVPSLCNCDPQTGQTICSLDCGGGVCVDAASQCEPVLCKLLCPFGFATDDRGCEVCQCKQEPRCGCVDDEDCTKVVGGCCPCSLGGRELAIAHDCVDQLVQCPVPPDQVPCVAIDECTTKVARCVAGECVLQNSL